MIKCGAEVEWMQHTRLFRLRGTPHTHRSRRVRVQVGCCSGSEKWNIIFHCNHFSVCKEKQSLSEADGCAAQGSETSQQHKGFCNNEAPSLQRGGVNLVNLMEFTERFSDKAACCCFSFVCDHSSAAATGRQGESRWI